MMIDNSLKEELRGKLSEYIAIVTEPSKKGKKMFNCPVCKSGTHNGSDSDGALHVDGNQWYCHSSKHASYYSSGGDIFDLYAQINDLDIKSDFPKIIKGLAEELGMMTIDSSTETNGKDKEKNKKNVELEKAKEINKKRIAQIERFAAQMPGSSAEIYLHKRGFFDEIIKKYRLGYNAKRGVFSEKTNKWENFESLVIPYPGTDYYTERLLTPKDVDKYQNQKGDAPNFIIKEDKSNFFFITEGQLDALSLIQAGAKNVIASHYSSKIENIIKNGFKIEGAIIVADNDDPGKKIADKLVNIFVDKKIKSIVVYPPTGFKDTNDILKLNPKKLQDLVMQWTKQLEEAKMSAEKTQDKGFKTVNVSDYLVDKVFEKDIEYFQKYKNRKIGFENIDKYMTLYPGVCCLGGASSLGKTTFAVNVVDNLLNRGETVLYFSLEQLPIELVTKSLAREMYRIDPLSPIDNIGIKNGEKTSALGEAKLRYSQTAERYQIIEGDFHFTAKKIVDYVEEFIEDKGVKPIVVIDYLQLIAPPEGFKGTLRESTDENLKAIKDMSKRNELFVLLISSFNRASYKEPVSMESFKESGMIEYTCDYILGLQLSILEDQEFFAKKGPNGGERDTNNYAKEKKLFKAINEDPKEVELVGLKNRNGKQRFKCFFMYNMKYDTFTPDMNSKYDTEYDHEHEKDSYKKRFENSDLRFEAP